MGTVAYWAGKMALGQTWYWMVVRSLVARLPGWSGGGGKLDKEYVFFFPVLFFLSSGFEFGYGHHWDKYSIMATIDKMLFLGVMVEKSSGHLMRWSRLRGEK